MRNRYKNLTIYLLMCLSLSGCTFFRSHLAKVETKIDERVRENNSAALLANKITERELEKTKTSLANTNWLDSRLNLENAQVANSVSGDFLGRNQDLVGLPIKNQQSIIEALTSTNAQIRAEAQKLQESKQSQEENWRAKEKHYQEQLQALGDQKEQERNDRIKFWTKWSLIGLLVIGGPIAACVFFPPLAGVLVGMVPKLAGVFGVIGKSTVTNIVKGVGEIRNTLSVEIDKAKEAAANNQPIKTFTAVQIKDMLDNEMAKSTDQKDKDIIDHLRKQVNL